MKLSFDFWNNLTNRNEGLYMKISFDFWNTRNLTKRPYMKYTPYHLILQYNALITCIEANGKIKNLQGYKIYDMPKVVIRCSFVA